MPGRRRRPRRNARYGLLRLDRVGIVTGDRVVGETPHERRITVRRGVLERPDAQMARRDPGEHRAGQHGVPRDLLAGRHHSQRPGSGDAERMHRLADHVLAQHRADGCLAVTTSGERRRDPSPSGAGRDDVRGRRAPRRAAAPDHRRGAARTHRTDGPRTPAPPATPRRAWRCRPERRHPQVLSAHRRRHPALRPTPR